MTTATGRHSLGSFVAPVGRAALEADAATQENFSHSATTVQRIGGGVESPFSQFSGAEHGFERTQRHISY